MWESRAWLFVILIVGSLFGGASTVAADTAPPEFYCSIAGSGVFHHPLHSALVISNNAYRESFRMKGTFPSCDVTAPIQGGTFTIRGSGHQLGGAYKSSCSNIAPLNLFPLTMKAHLMMGGKIVTMVAKMHHDGITESDDVEMNLHGGTTLDAPFQYPDLHMYLEVDISVAAFDAACASKDGFSTFSFGENFAYLRFGS
jgi:hypothetical protein